MSPKIIHVLLTNRYIYKTRYTQKEVEQYLKRLIEPVGMDQEYNYDLKGEYANGKFKLIRDGNLRSIKSWDKEPVTIYGEIIKTDSDWVDLDVEIKSNAINILSISVSLIGLCIFLRMKLMTSSVHASIWHALFPIIVASVMWIQAYYDYIYYKSEFEKALRLEPEETPVSSRVRL